MVATTPSEQNPESGAAIVERMIDLLGVKNQSALADALGVSSDVVAKWKKRGTRPYTECLHLARSRGASLEWLLTGEGEKLKQPNGDAPKDSPSESSRHGVYDSRHGYEEEDVRLAAVISWWRSWWAGADEDERSWAMVQLRRAIPESDAWIRRWLAEHAPARAPNHKKSTEP